MGVFILRLKSISLCSLGLYPIPSTFRTASSKEVTARGAYCCTQCGEGRKVRLSGLKAGSAEQSRAELPAWLALPDRRAVNRVRVMMLFSAPLLFKAFEVQVLLQLKRQVFL